MTERYRLGTTTVALGQIALAHADLAGAMDELRALSDRTGETSTLGVLDGADVVIVLQVPGRHPLRFERPAGTTGSGTRIGHGQGSSCLSQG